MISTNDRPRPAGSGHPHTRPVHRTAHPKGGLPPPKSSAQYQRSKSQPTRPGGDGRGWGPRTSATLPNPVPERPQGRVRVQAGDKCVAPAKSKAKKRTAVPGRPVDQSALSMDAIVWSDDVYTVAQLVQTFSNRLPVIAKVVEGYNTQSGEDLTVNQVVQVHSFDSQDRVHAVTQAEGACLSMPADYPLELFMRDEEKQERRTLRSTLATKSLPIKVLVTSVNENIEVSTVNVVGKHLTLTSRHAELFVRINIILDGWIDQKSIHAIPGFLGAKFVVALGMRGAAGAEWADYYGMFARSVRHLNFNLLRGYDGIIIEEDAGGIIQVEHPKRSSSGPVYENLEGEKRASTLEPKHPNEKRQSQPYENWKTKNPEKDNIIRGKFHSEKIRQRPTTLDTSSNANLSTGFDQTPDSRNRRQNSPEKNIDEPAVKRLPDVIVMYPEDRQVSPRRPGTPFSEADESDVEEMFKSVLDVAEEQETLRKQHEKDEKRRKFNDLKASESKAAEERAEMQAKLDKRQSVIDNQLQAEQRRENNANGPTTDLHKNEEVFTPLLSRPVEKPAKASYQPILFKDIVHGATQNNNKENILKVSENAQDKHVTPKAVVQPTIHNREPSSTNNSAINIKITANSESADGHVLHSSSQVQNTKGNINVMDDVPKLLDNLTVDQVGQCLHLLSMHNHSSDFRKHQVDGHLLTNLRENVLVNDFHFTPFNASKLTRFVRGWRPKTP